MVAPTKCEKWNILKIKIDNLHNTLRKFTKGRDKLYLLLSNQRIFYNKVSLGYEPKNNAKSISMYTLKIRSLNAILLSVITIIKMDM